MVRINRDFAVEITRDSKPNILLLPHQLKITVSLGEESHLFLRSKDRRLHYNWEGFDKDGELFRKFYLWYYILHSSYEVLLLHVIAISLTIWNVDLLFVKCFFLENIKAIVCKYDIKLIYRVSAKKVWVVFEAWVNILENAPIHPWFEGQIEQ